MAKDNTVVTVMETRKAVMWVFLTIALAMFMLGYVSRSKKEETVKFTYEEIQMIENFQQQVKTENPKAEVVVYKDKKGNLMLGWDD